MNTVAPLLCLHVRTESLSTLKELFKGQVEGDLLSTIMVFTSLMLGGCFRLTDININNC